MEKNQIYTIVRKLEKEKEFWGNRINVWKIGFLFIKGYPSILNSSSIQGSQMRGGGALYLNIALKIFS